MTSSIPWPVSGFSPSETAVFVLSLKEPLFELLREEIEDVEVLAREIWVASLLIDKLGLHTVEVYQKGREEVIRAAAGGTARTVDAGRPAMGLDPGIAVDRHSRL